MPIKIKRYRHGLFIKLMLECFALQQHLCSKFDWVVIFSLVAMLSVMRSIPQRGNAVFGHLDMLFCFGKSDSKTKIELQPQ